MYKFTCKQCKKEFEYPFEKQTCPRELCYTCGEQCANESKCANEGKLINLGDTGCDDCPLKYAKLVQMANIHLKTWMMTLTFIESWDKRLGEQNRKGIHHVNPPCSSNDSNNST